MASNSSSLIKLDKVTEELHRFHDINEAISEGYVHYDGYDTFSMGEHWYNKKVYETNTCDESIPSHLQYLVINGERKLIGTGYVCLPQTYVRQKNEMFGQNVIWHTHGPAWCLLPNGSTEDYRDLADSLPNAFTSADWQTICRQNGGTPVSQDINMLHTWNWIPAPNGKFAHENYAIPFLRVGLPIPDASFLNSEIGGKTINLLKLAHGDTQWWYWRGFTVIGADNIQRQKGWQILQEARIKGQAIQNEMIKIASLDDDNFSIAADSGEKQISIMHNELTAVFTNEQMKALTNYISSIETHEHHDHEHH
ncbi:MAG: hypothetical protein AAGB35_05360 [Pseudomonadota bacterium]